MTVTLKNAKRVIGIKQVTKAVKNDLAKCVYIADDAMIFGNTMAELGKSCNIEVGAAAVALL